MKCLKTASILIVLSVSPVGARPSMRTMRWLISGELATPPAVQQAQSIEDLEIWLKNEDTFVRASAVRKLGELGGPEAIPQLLQIFRDEPEVAVLEVLPVVKMEVVKTLGRMHSDEEIGPVLVSLLEDEWGKRPAEGDVAEKRWIAKSGPVMGYVLKELGPYVSEESAFKVVESVANPQHLSSLVVTRRPSIGISAWRLYIKGRIGRDKLDETGQMEYLLGFFDRLMEDQSQEGQWPAWIQCGAARAILLADYEVSKLETLSRQIQVKINEYDIAEEKDFEYNRSRRRLAYVNRLLREKAQQGKSTGTGGKGTQTQ